MFFINQKQRLDIILMNLQKNKSLTLQEVMRLTGSSRDTARRDIIKLTNGNLAIRNYGGISLLNSYNKLSVFLDRMDNAKEEKRELARKASQFVHSDSFLYLDVSTTISYLPQFLKDMMHLYTVTNSLDIADNLLRLTSSKVRILGGSLDREKRCVVGTKAIWDLDEYHFDIAFMSAVGLDENGVYYAYEEDNEYKKKIRKQAKTIILLVDHKKIDSAHYFHVFNLSDIDVLITNGSVPLSIQKALKVNHVKTITVTGREND